MRVWVLNLDADDELAHGDARALGAGALARWRDACASLRGTLLGAGDVVLGLDEVPRRGLPGMSWCSTPTALARLGAAGARLPPAPSVEVVRRVNHRAWAASRGLSLPGAAWITDPRVLDAKLSAPWPARGWLLREPFGFAGRGRLHLRDVAEFDRLRPRVVSLLGREGLLVEPFVSRIEDYALHGWLDAQGALTRGEVTRQRCADDGRWLESERSPGGIEAHERRALHDALDDTAEGLRAAGYFGPFGVDAFAWDDGGARRFQPRCEVNARYGMGWAIGMGARRPDLTGR